MRFADLFALEIREPPFNTFDMTITLVTSSLRTHDPLLMWMVERVREAATVDREPPGSLLTNTN
jgi:hypothetical protein